MAATALELYVSRWVRWARGALAGGLKSIALTGALAQATNIKCNVPAASAVCITERFPARDELAGRANWRALQWRLISIACREAVVY